MFLLQMRQQPKVQDQIIRPARVRIRYSKRSMTNDHPRKLKITNHAKRVLIIRPSALGDVCRSVPALVTLQKALPEARIDWLVQTAFAPAIAAHPALHQIIPFDRKQYRKLLLHPVRWNSLRKWLGQLKQNRYDMVFDLQGLARSGFFTWITAAKTRVGYANAREGGYLGYNYRYLIDPNRHAVDRMLGLLKAHGFEPCADMRLFTPTEDLTWADQYLNQINIISEPFALLAPTAQWRCKCWPIDRFISLAKRLRDEKKMKLLVIAAPHEQQQVQPLLDALNLSLPPTTIGRMMGLIQRASLMICHDSGPLHMAVGLGTPTVSLFGPTDPKLVGPYQQLQWVVQPDGIDQTTLSQSYRTRKDDPSLMAQITLQQVWDRIESRLSSPDPHA